MTEALTRYIEAQQEEGKLQGFKLNCCCPQITHLTFADNKLIFAKASMQEIETWINIMEDFGLATGLNFDKSSVYFNPTFQAEL